MNKSMILAAILLALSFTMNAKADNFEDSTVSVEEAATATLHCAQKVGNLLPDREFLGSITAKHAHVSDLVYTKTFRFEIMSGGFIMGPPPTPVAMLIVTQTVTEPPPGLMDAPASMGWSCRVIKKTAAQENK